MKKRRVNLRDPNISGAKTGNVGSTMPVKLLAKLDALANKQSLKKHVYYDALIIEYLRKWNAGEVALVTICAPKTDSKFHTFYLLASTIKLLVKVAEIDGSRVSHIVRTALSYAVIRRTNITSKDDFGSDKFLPKRSELNFDIGE